MTENETPRPPSLLERLLGSTEPVRRAMYPMVVAAVALLVFYGRLDPGSVPLWLALAVALLGAGGTEAARAIAWSPRSVTARETAWDAYAEAEFARGVTVATERTPDQLAAQTAEIYAHGGEHSTNRCREVEDGRRCRLAPHPDPEDGGVPHKFD